jgi:hypothetical protein
MEFYKVPGDFFVTVNLVPYGHILYICICLRDGGGGRSGPFNVGLDQQALF